MTTLQQSLFAYNDMILQFAVKGYTSIKLDELHLKKVVKILSSILELNIHKLSNRAALLRKHSEEKVLADTLITLEQLKIDLESIKKYDVKKIERCSIIYGTKLNKDLNEAIQELYHEQANEQRMWENQQDPLDSESGYIERWFV